LPLAAPLNFPRRGKSRSVIMLARPAFSAGHRGRSHNSTCCFEARRGSRLKYIDF